MDRLTDYPGLQARDGWHERAYRTDAGEVARVRVRPQQVDPAIAAAANLPVMTSAIVVFISSALVDEAGQVVTVAGWGAITDACPHTWHSEGERLDPDRWIDGLAEQSVADLFAKVADRRAADAAGLLPPAPAPIEVEPLETPPAEPTLVPATLA